MSTHAESAHKHRLVLSLWAGGLRTREIMERTGYCRGSVLSIVAAARKRGNAKAARRNNMKGREHEI